jgi:Flp pilus assembly protein TadB
VARSLLRLPDDQRAPELARRSAAGSWEHSLATELVAAAGDQARIAAVNDAVAQLELRLEERAGWPSAALRIAALSALLLAVIAYLIHRPDAVLPVLAVGGVGALVSLDAKKRAQRGAKAQREAIDALVAAVAGKLESPARPGSRVRSRPRARARA